MTNIGLLFVTNDIIPVSVRSNLEKKTTYATVDFRADSSTHLGAVLVVVAVVGLVHAPVGVADQALVHPGEGALVEEVGQPDPGPRGAGQRENRVLLGLGGDGGEAGAQGHAAQDGLEVVGGAGDEAVTLGAREGVSGVTGGRDWGRRG